MNTAVNKEHFYSISLLRMLAMLSIVACHILQYYGNFLAWWFNVGVNIFFIISGYLYGLRKYKFTNAKECFCFTGKFYRKEFIKLLVPYYLMLFAVIPFYFLLKANSLAQLANLIVFQKSEVTGFGHIWFFHYILVCYFFIPFWYFIPEKKCKTGILAVLFIAILPFCEGSLVWYASYLFGMLVARLNENSKIQNCLGILSVLLGIVLSIFCIRYEVDRVHWNLALNIQKLFIGGGLTMLCLFILRKNNLPHLKKTLLLSDKYSYEVFLTHQLFIFGAFSVMNIFAYETLNVCFVFFASFCAAFLLHRVKERII